MIHNLSQPPLSAAEKIKVMTTDREAALGNAYEEVKYVAPGGISKLILNQLSGSCLQYKDFCFPAAFALHLGFGAANVALLAEHGVTQAATRLFVPPVGLTGVRESHFTPTRVLPKATERGVSICKLS